MSQNTAHVALVPLVASMVHAVVYQEALPFHSLTLLLLCQLGEHCYSSDCRALSAVNADRLVQN